MNRIGLALSGGGFRATLYHLGLVRFLRDAGLLSQVTHITSVSGGSVFAAHLVLNWDLYNGSSNDFEAAASKLLAFVRMDVRNRIARRVLLTVPLRWPRRLLGLSNRKLTRTGLLEYHYEKHLYGDTGLFELPESPQLHILATNLTEGCLCSFSRDGLLMMRRQGGHRFRLDHIPSGLATVPMAVAASSAFPGFFPPLELTGADVGASAGEFGRQAYTDGGVFDNLGIRMFRSLERSLLRDRALSPDDFFDFPAVLEALWQASKSSEETPLRRLAQVLREAANSSEETPLRRLAQVLGEVSGQDPQAHPSVGNLNNVPALSSPGSTTASTTASTRDHQELVLSNLQNVMRHYQFNHEPLFARLKPVDPEAAALLHATRVEGRTLNVSDQLWLNRHLLEAGFRETTGRPCFRKLNSALDGVIVSDVGKRIRVRASRRAGGLVRTAMRASGILMDRVWQLEHETFQDTPGFVFVPITDVVEPSQDPTALHPEVQRQMANIRTDFDRFSLLEISSLVRHGYCVGRKACQARPDLFGADLPRDVPWDPIPRPYGAAAAVPVAMPAEGHSVEPAETMVKARTLQASAFRRIWSSLFDFRDWSSYIYVPLFFPLFVLLPYGAFEYYKSAERSRELVKWLYHGSPDLSQVQVLLQTLPATWRKGSGAAAQERDSFEGLDNTGYTILKETRIADLRLWNPTDRDKSLVQYVRRLTVMKDPDELEHDNEFFVKLTPTHNDAQVRFPPQRLEPTLIKTPDKPDPLIPTKQCMWGVLYDFKNVPNGRVEELSVIDQGHGANLGRNSTGSNITFQTFTYRAALSMWILMPQGKSYGSWLLTRRSDARGRADDPKPEKIEVVTPVEEFVSGDSSIIGFELVGVKGGYTYEINWTYK
jgi:predicted acylesterase/phospholipase RssA